MSGPAPVRKLVFVFLQESESIGVRDGGQGAAAPPIRAVCRHTFGQRAKIIRAKHNTCLNNTNLGYVTGVNGKNSATTTESGAENFCYYPPPLNFDPGKFLLLPPPHRIHSGKTRSAPPKRMLARTPMSESLSKLYCSGHVHLTSGGSLQLEPTGINYHYYIIVHITLARV